MKLTKILSVTAITLVCLVSIAQSRKSPQIAATTLIKAEKSPQYRK